MKRPPRNFFTNNRMTASNSWIRFPFVDGNSSFILPNSSLLLRRELRGNKLGVHFSPLRLRHLPQIRQCKVCLRIQSFHRRIWGSLCAERYVGDKVLSELGLRVVRFRNEEVEKDLSAVMRKICKLASAFSFTSSNRSKIKP